jgi:lipid kinase YegS
LSAAVEFRRAFLVFLARLISKGSFMSDHSTAADKRSLRIVLNGKSAELPSVREAVLYCRDQGHDVEVRVTWEGGQAEEFALEAARAGREIVVAAGGDGTASAVVAGVLKAGEQADTAIGIIPLGTANDFANGCHIPLDPRQALQLIASADARAIDVGLVNDRPFINVASAGIGAEVTAETPAGMKRVLGGAAYSLMGILKAFTMTPHEGRIVTPDGEYIGKMALMAIGNGRLAGGGFQVAPRALLDDGLLDLVVVPDVSFPETGPLVSELIRLESEEPQRVLYRQFASFEIQANHEMAMNLDGEPIRASTFRVEVLPRRLKFLLPPDAPLSDA